MVLTEFTKLTSKCSNSDGKKLVSYPKSKKKHLKEDRGKGQTKVNQHLQYKNSIVDPHRQINFQVTSQYLLFPFGYPHLTTDTVKGQVLQFLL